MFRKLWKQSLGSSDKKGIDSNGTALAHEIGHSLGLVDGDFLNAGTGAAQRHNGISNPRKLMNHGGLFFIEDRLNPQPMIHWMDDNRRYLEFILPISEQQ